ncbi:CheR family methyltransferase [Geomonas ferrireducens]|uniref:CheR family methyltransferase n=1 Tax=Geomonas ferrireducens TaxID=2570227 RepID=UPI0010A86B1A|nr:CheR family methyltransferase [Geomonas ferrireducens]
MSLQILVISDNDPFAAYLCGLLQSAGHTPLPVCPAKEAFPAVRRRKPDLIILAVEDSSVPSLAVEHRVQTPHGPCSVPVIVISDCLRLEAELLQVFDFIPTPVDEKRLFDDLALVALRKSGPQHEEELSSGLACAFSRHILKHTGLHFEARNQAALARGLRKRMAALRMWSFEEYLQYLELHGEDRHELQRLLQFLTVGETYFFRYPAHFDVLRERLAFLKDDPAPVRIWSAGCSTGEEPYSIAMTVMEALPDWRERDIRIIATDINNRSLKRAREGVYSPWSMRITRPDQVQRYFRRVGESFLIRDEVKQLVRFAHLNLSVPCHEPLCEELQGLDAIFCRNVLIYFTTQSAEQMLERFTDALAPGGLLFLGHSETLLQHEGLPLSLRRQERSFYYVKGGQAQKERRDPGTPQPEWELTPEQMRLAAAWLAAQAPTVLAPSAPAAAVEAPPPAEDAPLPLPGPVPQGATELFRQARELFDREEYDAALALLEQLLQETPDNAEALVLTGFILAGKGELPSAMESCERALKCNDLLAEAYFLKGVLLDAEDRLTEAAAEYRKALLLDHDFIMPRYHMGRLHLRQGRVNDAARELRNSIRILSRLSDDQTIPFSGGLTRAVCMLQLQNELARVA